jgi:hypothetical protein
VVRVTRTTAIIHIRLQWLTRLAVVQASYHASLEPLSCHGLRALIRAARTIPAVVGVFTNNN